MLLSSLITRITARARQAAAGERGESLASVLVGVSLSSILLTAFVSTYISASTIAKDRQIRSEAEEKAKSLVDLMGFDIRLAGAGMPLGQATFLMTDATLGNAPLPILTDATATEFAIRRNETGVHTVLTANYTPSSSALVMSVFSGADFKNGDTVYVSNSTSGGTAGLMGTVSSAGATSVTIQTGFSATPSTTFKAGSLVERVSTLRFKSYSDWSGITRRAGTTSVVLAPTSAFSVEYLDSAGNVLALPLTSATIASQLSALRVTVNVRGRLPLKNGSTYMATRTMTVALRNLVMTR